MTSLANAAVGYAEIGWPVFPVWWCEDGVCQCREGKACARAGKHPMEGQVPRGLLDASTDKDIVQAWWSRYPQANIGSPMGKISDVVDIDGAEGYSALEQLQAIHGELPPTLTSATSKGEHMHFQHREGIGNWVRPLPGMDIRTTGGYVIMPPSIHQTGKVYEWGEEEDIAPWPDWLWDELQDAHRASRTPGPKAAHEGNGQATVKEGGRNAYLASRAGTLRHAGFSPDQIEAALQVVNTDRCAPPLAPEEVTKIARSVGGYEPTNKDPADEAEEAKEIFYSIKELEDLGHEDTDWILGDFLAPGEVTGIVGREKEGKTTFLYAMLAAIEKGQMFMGRTPQKTRAVIATEEPAQLVLEKARRFGIKEARILPRHSLHRLQGLEERLRACVAQAEEHDAGIIVLDSFAKVAGLTGEQENQAGTIQHAFDLIHEIVPEDISTMVVHHASKGEKTGTHITRGSTAWAGAVDTFIAFTKPQRSSAVRRLEWTGRHAEYPKPATIELKRDQYLITNVSPDDAPRIKEGAEKVADALARHAGPMTRSDLFKATNLADRTLREALDFLMAYQRVTVEGLGQRGNPKTYSLTEGEGDGAEEGEDDA